MKMLGNNNNTTLTSEVQNEVKEIGSVVEGYIWCSLFVVEAITIIFLNILAVIVFVRKPCLRKRSTYLLINLSLADVCIGALVIPTSVFRRGNTYGLWRIEMTEAAISFTYGIDTFFFGCSLVFLVSISIERLNAMRNPMQHRLMSSSSYRRWVFVVWGASMLYTIFTISLLSFNILGLLVWFILAGCVLACLLILTGCYIAIFATVRRNKNPTLTDRHARTERRLTVTLFIVTLVSLTVWLPYVLFTFLSAPMSRLLSPEAVLRVRSICEFLFYANSFLNAILYTIRMPEFRKEIRSLVRFFIPLGVTMCVDIQFVGKSNKKQTYAVHRIEPFTLGVSVPEKRFINSSDLDFNRNGNVTSHALCRVTTRVKRPDGGLVWAFLGHLTRSRDSTADALMVRQCDERAESTFIGMSFRKGKGPGERGWGWA